MTFEVGQNQSPETISTQPEMFQYSNPANCTYISILGWGELGCLRDKNKIANKVFFKRSEQRPQLGRPATISMLKSRVKVVAGLFPI